MKKISLLLCGLLMLSGCANMLSKPECAYKIKPQVQVQKVKQKSKLATTIYFDDGSADFTAQEKKRLRDIAFWALKNNADIKVVGHSSSRTRPTTLVEHTMINLGISSKRAVNTIKLLAQYGVPLHKMRYEALADSQPAVLELNAKDEALNRRVEIFYLYQE